MKLGVGLVVGCIVLGIVAGRICSVVVMSYDMFDEFQSWITEEGEEDE